MVKQISLGHIKCWLRWDVYDKLIPILSVVGHKVIFLDQAKVQDVKYSLRVIPDRIKISVYFSNFVGVFHSCVTIDTYILTIERIFDI